MCRILGRLALAFSLSALAALIVACGVRVNPGPPPNPNPAPAPAPVVQQDGNPRVIDAPKPPKVEQKPEDMPVVKMSAAQYARAFASRVSDPWKYHHRILEVTGKVTWYGYELDGRPYLMLEGDQRCVTEDARPASKALPGQTVTLRGQATSRWGVEKFTIVKVTGDGPPTVSAEQLRRELAADKATAEKKWKDKVIVVSGEVTVGYKNGGIMLTEPNKPPVIQCWFYGSTREVDRERLHQMELGRKVKVLGKYEGNGTVGIGEPIEVLP